MKTVCIKNKCVGCRVCEEVCPKSATKIDDKAAYMNAVIDIDHCINCKMY